MDELDDLAAFGLAEVDEDRAAGEWDDPHAPVAAAALTTAQAVDLARWTIGEGEPPEWYSAWTIDRDEDMARTVLAWAPVVASAGPLADALAAMWEADPTRRPDGGPAVDFVAAYRAAGGGA